jgi:hypothetical protein
MPDARHFHARDLRSVTRLAVDATLGVVGIVETLHHNIQRVAPPLGPASDRPTRGITGLVYRSIRGATRAAGAGVDLLLRPLEALLHDRSTDSPAASAEREAVVAALNGVLGDHLAQTGNPLAIPMTLQHDGRPLVIDRPHLAAALPGAQPRLLLLVHGLCMHPRQWTRRSASDPGARLARASGSTLLHLHYNTGRPIGANGRELAALMETLAAAWPVELQEIAIVGHSMGGLVARSACHYGEARGDRWPALLRKLVFLGAPHHGSPVERGGHVIDVVLGASPYTAAFARIGRQRSAGIVDLRHGNVLEGTPERAPPQHVPLPASAACYAAAGVLEGGAGAWKGRLLGDGLVTVDSALGRHEDPARSLAFTAGRQRVFEGVGHLGLLDDPAVVDQVERWLTADG